MHIRREIDHILDDIIELIAQKKSSSKEEREGEEVLFNHLCETINLKTNNGKRAKGMWTDSPEFLHNK